MNAEDLARVLREYGAAIRGDWGSIDGRSEQGTLETFADAVTNPGAYTVQQLRDMADICPAGNGHWTEYCDSDCGAAS